MSKNSTNTSDYFFDISGYQEHSLHILLDQIMLEKITLFSIEKISL